MGMTRPKPAGAMNRAALCQMKCCLETGPSCERVCQVLRWELLDKRDLQDEEDWRHLRPETD